MRENVLALNRSWSVAQRQSEAEVMDDPHLEESAHFRALAGLARLNRLSRSASTIWSELARLHSAPSSGTARVLDLACGGGDITRRLVRLAASSGLPLEFDGCDISPRALQFAAEAAQREGLDCRFFQIDICGGFLPRGYDYYVSSLFLHHLQENQVIGLLRQVALSAGRGCVLTDLNRTAGGLMLARCVPRFVTFSPVVHGDAVRSARAAFAFQEIKSLARQAGLDRVNLARRWPSRWVLTWQRDGSLGG